MPDALAAIEFLARSAHRVGVLETLADGPRDRRELRAATGASDPTIGRILGDFEDRGWSRRDGHDYVLTGVGAYVAEHFATLVDRMAVEGRFRDVWPWLPTELPGFSVDLVADAVLTVVAPGDPYAPATRCGSLFRAADWIRGFDAGLTAPHHFEALYQRIVDGMDTELILPSEVSRKIRRTYPEQAAAVVASEHLRLWWNDDLPLYRLTVFPDRVGIGGYDPDSGVLRVYVDTPSPEARSWAESTFRAFRRDATPFPSSVSTA